MPVKKKSAPPPTPAMGKKLFVIFFVILLLFLLGAIWLAVAGQPKVNEPPQETAAEALPAAPPEPANPEIKIAAINETGAVVIDIEYPEFANLADSAMQDSINRLLKGKFEGEAENFKTEAAENAAPELSVPSTLSVRFDTVLFNDSAVSIEFSHSSYVAGAAHPDLYYTVFNYDLKNGKEVSLSDFFNPKANYLPELSKYAAAELKKSLSESGAYDKATVAQGTKALAANFTLFGFDDKKLILIFNPGQVAPIAAGAQFIEVPYADWVDWNHKSPFLQMLAVSEAPAADDAAQLLQGLRNETSLALGEITDGFFNWLYQNPDGSGIKTEILAGKKISGEGLSGADFGRIAKFFIDSGYAEDLNNAADGVSGTQKGYFKGGTVCLASSIFMEMEPNEEGVSAPISDLRKIEVVCGLK